MQGVYAENAGAIIPGEQGVNAVIAGYYTTLQRSYLLKDVCYK